MFHSHTHANNYCINAILNMLPVKSTGTLESHNVSDKYSFIYASRVFAGIY